MCRVRCNVLIGLAVVGLLAVGVFWCLDWRAPLGWGTPAARPNVLIVSLDTFRADHMGFLGAHLENGESPTPHCDAFADDCVGPKEAITPSPLTLPAHVTLMSGLDPDRHGVRENDSFRVPGERAWSLLAEDLRHQYETGAIVSGQPIESRYGLDAGFGTYLDTDRSDDPTDRLRFRERPAVETTERAMEWLASAGERPWFLFVHYFDAHGPYIWHGPHDGLPKARNAHDRYRSETMHLDEQVGRLLAGLPNGGRDTLVLIVGDHGEGLGDHQETTHGYTLHQSTTRVPFLLKLPDGLDAPALSGDGPPARLVDVHPTVLDVCGIVDDTQRDGRSLLAPAPAEWYAFGETLYPYYQFGYAHERFVMDRDRKLITGGTSGPRLYAWRTDRDEEADLATAEPDRVTSLTQRLNAHLTRPTYGNAENVAVEPNAAFPYMGGRPLKFDTEPTVEDNARRPSVETRWEVIDALDKARTKLRPPRPQPHLASSLLAAHAGELKTNPALLWWTARAL
ncbi:MAG: sulfatase, partial [Planctomycetes bacterium]|nr:sulfatase [Planctomycetota bacterium]